MRWGMGLLAAGVVCAAPLAASAQSRILPPPDPSADPELIAEATRRVAEARYIALNAFALSDADGDGRLTREEWRARSWLIYDRFDRDESDTIDWSEFQNMKCGGYPQHFDQYRWCSNAVRGHFRLLAGFRSAATRRAIADRSMRNFRRVDLNGDGFVTPEEERDAPGPPLA
jgi:hypothetical protein